MTTIFDTLQHIITGIVSDPTDISISQTETNGLITISVTAPEDLIGQIIGKEGKIIKSIRTILNLCYPNLRYLLEVNPKTQATIG
jgi:predicted RNA-binding protein YlqC (UPF0109 family)